MEKTALAARMGVGACLVVACTTPSLFDAHAERAFDEPKIVMLQPVAALAAAALLIWLFENSRSLPSSASHMRPGRMILTSVAILTAAYLMASLLSIAPRMAWEGAYIRRQGTITFLSDLVFFLCVALFVRREAQVRQVVLTLLLASAFPTAYAISQAFGFDLIAWHNPTPGRVTSTAGNPIFLGGYLIMVWPLALACAVRSGRLVFVLLTVAQTATILLTGSVGVWLALAAAILVLLGALLPTLHRSMRVAVVLMAGAGAALLLLFAVTRRPVSNATPSTRGGLPPVASRSGEVRLLLWQRSIEFLRQNPRRALVGWGPDTIRLTLGRYDPAPVRRVEGPATADRSHNGVLDTMLTIGFIGLAAQTLLLLTIALRSLRRLGLLDSAGDTSRFGCFVAASVMLCLALAYWLDRHGGFISLGWAAGLVAGLLYYLLYRNVPSRTVAPWTTGRMTEAALLSGVIGHYVETQTGIATAVSELYFWMFAGLIAGGASMVPGRPGPSDPSGATAVQTDGASTIRSRDNAIVLGVMTGLGLATLTFDFAGRPIDLRLIAGSTLFACILFLTGLALQRCADTALSGSSAEARTGAYVTFSVASLGIWLTFLAASSFWTRFAAEAFDQGSPPAAQLAEQGLSRLVGLTVTLFAACLVLATLPRAPEVENTSTRLAAGSGWSGRPAVIPALLVTTLVTIAVIRSVRALRADELSRLGTALTGDGQWREAEWCYTRAFQLQPTRDVYSGRVGAMSLAAYRRSASRQVAWLEKARLAYWTAHEINPLEADYLLQLALVEGTWADAWGAAGERARHLEGAHQHLDAAARLAPRDPQVWNEWGKLCLREGRFSGAVPMFERSLGLDETSPDTHLFYADALAGVGQYARAIPEYERAQALGLDRPLPAISGRALALAEMRRFQEAVAANMEALEISPEDFTSRKNIALLYEQLGDIAQAAAYAAAAAAVADASEKPAIEAFASGLQARLRNRGPQVRNRVYRRE